MKNFYALVLLACYSFTAHASDFYIDGFWYDIIDKDARNVKVARGPYDATKVVIPSRFVKNDTTWTIAQIGDNAFIGASKMTSVEIPNTVTAIGNGAFFGCTGLTSLDLPNSVMSIDEMAFEKCSALTLINFGTSLTIIGPSAFWDCPSITSVNIPNSVETIGDYAFGFASALTSVNLGVSLKTIGTRAFEDCTSLTSITIPNSVTTIGAGAFYDCSSLNAVILGTSVSTLGIQAFMDCISLTSVTCLAVTPPKTEYSDNPSWNGSEGNATFYNVKLDKSFLWVPTQSIDKYKSTKPWSSFYKIGIAGVEDVKLDEGMKVWNDNGIIHVEGGEAPCEVYDMQGRQVLKTSERSISGLGTGVYLVKVGGQTFKIVL